MTLVLVSSCCLKLLHISRNAKVSSTCFFFLCRCSRPDNCRFSCRQATFRLPDLPTPDGPVLVFFTYRLWKRSPAPAAARIPAFSRLRAPADGLVSFVCGSRCDKETLTFLSVSLDQFVFRQRRAKAEFTHVEVSFHCNIIVKAFKRILHICISFIVSTISCLNRFYLRIKIISLHKSENKSHQVKCLRPFVLQLLGSNAHSAPTPMRARYIYDTGETFSRVTLYGTLARTDIDFPRPAFMHY